MTNTTTALQALKRIATIENKLDGGDWDEIGEARLIALEAIAALAAPAPALDAPADTAFMKTLHERDALRRTLEVIALLGSKNPALDAAECLVDAGFWIPQFAEAARASQPPAPALDAPAELSDAWLIAFAEQAGFRWLPPDDEDGGFPGGFDMSDLSSMRKLLAARASQPATPAQDAAATVPRMRELLAEARTTLEMWKDVAPAISLCADIDKVLAATPAPHPVAGQVQAVPELRERLDMAHDASLDDDHRGCRAILMEIIRMLDAAPTAPQAPAPVPLTEHHKLDNDQQVFFYEQDFYVLSNFSAFNLKFNGLTFPTSEHAYHYEKFAYERAGESTNDAFQRRNLAMSIKEAPSAHEAFKLAERWKGYRRADWDAVKVDIMREILRAKASQHEYVRCKLLATGDRELIEDSWRDDYWGWGPNRDGQNMLGKLWMEVRAELKAGITPTTKEQQA